jgi:hypothetical protein
VTDVDAQPRGEGPPDDAGSGIVNAAYAGTGTFVAIATAASLAPDRFATGDAVVSCALFAFGAASFLWAYALGVSRSRDEVVTLPGLFFLSHTAPKEVAFRLRLALAVQVVAAVASAAIRPYTNVAFGVLVPVFGLGLMALWGGRYGTFHPKAHAEPAARDAGPEG